MKIVILEFKDDQLVDDGPFSTKFVPISTFSVWLYDNGATELFSIGLTARDGTARTHEEALEIAQEKAKFIAGVIGCRYEIEPVSAGTEPQDCSIVVRVVFDGQCVIDEEGEIQLDQKTAQEIDNLLRPNCQKYSIKAIRP